MSKKNARGKPTLENMEELEIVKDEVKSEAEQEKQQQQSLTVS